MSETTTTAELLALAEFAMASDVELYPIHVEHAWLAALLRCAEALDWLTKPRLVGESENDCCGSCNAQVEHEDHDDYCRATRVIAALRESGIEVRDG